MSQSHTCCSYLAYKGSICVGNTHRLVILFDKSGMRLVKKLIGRLLFLNLFICSTFHSHVF